MDHQNNVNRLIVELRSIKEESENYKRHEDVKRKKSEDDLSQTLLNVEHNYKVNIQHLNTEISNKNNEIQQLKSQIQGKDKSIQTLNDHLKSFESNTGKVTEQITNQSQILENQRKDILTLEGELLRYKQLSN